MSRSDINRKPPGIFLGILYREIKYRMDKKKEAMGFTSPQLNVLGEICRLSKFKPEVYQKDLEEILHLTHPTLTEIIKILERKGAVITEQSSLDKRYKKLTVSEEYNGIDYWLYTLDWEIFDEIAVDLSETDKENFREMCEIMLHRIDMNR